MTAQIRVCMGARCNPLGALGMSSCVPSWRSCVEVCSHCSCVCDIGAARPMPLGGRSALGVRIGRSTSSGCTLGASFSCTLGATCTTLGAWSLGCSWILATRF